MQDLLNPSGENLEVRQSCGTTSSLAGQQLSGDMGAVYVPDLSVVSVTCLQDVLKVMATGSSHR